MKYNRKQIEVEARQFNGPHPLRVISAKKGEQTARSGDFLVTDEEFIKKYRDGQEKDLRDREKREGVAENYYKLADDLPQPKGSVYVVSKEDFFADFEIPNPDEHYNGDTSNNLYGAPHFDTVEQAQQASANSPTQPFHCTIADKPNLFSIQKDGTITQVPVVPPDPGQDVGPTHEEGARVETEPLVLQNTDVHEVAPVSEHQAPITTSR